jgi:hypothetical protein
MDPEQADWLEIKPKEERRSGRTYDIRDHNEIKRLVGALLDGLYGKHNWTRDQHEIPLRAALFEADPTQARRIRLRLPAAQLRLIDPDSAEGVTSLANGR